MIHSTIQETTVDTKKKDPDLAKYDTQIEHFRIYKFVDPLNGEMVTGLGPSYLPKMIRRQPNGYSFSHTGLVMEPKGGVTVARITNVDTGDCYIGASVCSTKEVFCRKKGREIAIGRAFAAKKCGVPCKFPSEKSHLAQAAFIICSPANDGCFCILPV